MNFWNVFWPCFAAFWAISSIATIPLAVESYRKAQKKVGSPSFCVFVFLMFVLGGPLILGAIIGELDGK